MTGWLFDTLLATSLLMVLVLLVREPVRRQFGPSAAYGLWLIPALRLAVPPITRTVERVVPAAEPLRLSSLHPAQRAVASAAQPSLVDRLGGWESLALWTWLAGASAMLVGGLLLYAWQRREVLRDSVQVARLGKIRIVHSPAVTGPMAFGIFDRVIALPIDFDDRYSPEERRLAVAHELAHHCYGDLIVGHFAFALLCLQWFNPLAWVSHSAFRFDQEAACDARVLEKASSDNRAAYAQAIAKAASGSGLLFAGALDRPRTLHRRLKSMVARQTSARRTTGKALVALTAAAALPLTASHATEYVDVPATPPVPAIAPVTPAAEPSATPATTPAPATVVPALAAAPARNQSLPMPDLGGVTLGKGDVAFMDDDTILIDGKHMRIEQLTPQQRAKLRAEIAKSQRDLARESAELPQRLAEARQTIERVHSGAMKRDYQQDIQDLRRDLAEIDSQSAELRAAGEDPAKRKDEILRDLREAQSVDIDKELAEALRDSNPAKITAELRSAEDQMERILARLNRLDRR